MSLLSRVKDFWSRKDREALETNREMASLEDELRLLENESRYHGEAAFLADRARMSVELEKESRDLLYETREPQRSMMQGRCQKVLEEIERPDAVKARIEEVQKRLGELRGDAVEPDDGVPVDRRVAHA